MKTDATVLRNYNFVQSSFRLLRTKYNKKKVLFSKGKCAFIRFCPSSFRDHPSVKESAVNHLVLHVPWAKSLFLFPNPLPLPLGLLPSGSWPPSSPLILSNWYSVATLVYFFKVRHSEAVAEPTDNSPQLVCQKFLACPSMDGATLISRYLWPLCSYHVSLV